MNLKHLKNKCSGCEKNNAKMNNEHVFPEWLILRTKTNQTSIRWVKGNKVNPLSATLPLCENCNTEFGDKLEKPVSKIFSDLESGKGISEFEAEQLIRWLWKLEGLFWIAGNPLGKYSEVYTLKGRILQPINSIRSHLILAISIISQIDESFSDLPMGVNSECEINAIFVSGVFSKIAMMVVQEEFEEFIPSYYSKIKFNSENNILSNAKLFYPKYGFRDDVQAVGVSIEISKILTFEHDKLAREVIKNKSS